MTLAPGMHLGPYEILALIGAGGMGEVYRARDPRLGRDVAIKVLPPNFTEDAERLRRFQHEAKTLAALHHPNLLMIYDLVEHENGPCLVMELLQGESMRARIKDGPPPWREAVGLGRQAAEGLAAAHRAGIIHRDLKPDNLFLCSDGTLKILDFGLAKFRAPVDPEASTEPLDSSSSLTREGAVMGTAAYMSPEQTVGKPLDARSDLFSLGTTLWELVTGSRPFAGATQVDLLHAIAREQPLPMPPDLPVPPGLQDTLLRCLEKDPERRFQTARDLAFALQSLLGAGNMPKAASLRRWIPGLLAVGLAMASLGGGWMWGLRQGHPLPAFHRLTFRRGNILRARFANDGRTIVYSAAWDGRPVEVFAMNADGGESRSLGLPSCDLMAVSSKGELAVLKKTFALMNTDGAGMLCRVPLGGGSPREVVAGVVDADFDPQGKDLAVIRYEADGSWGLEYPIGKVLYRTSGYLQDLHFCPKGGKLAFLAFSGSLPASLVVLDLKGGKKVLKEGIAQGLETMEQVAWLRSGEGLIVSGGHELGDEAISRVDLAGHSFPLYRSTTHWAIHDVDPRGRVLGQSKLIRLNLAFRGPKDGGDRDLSWFDGSWVRAISEDGATVLFNEVQDRGGGYTGSSDLYLRRTDGTPPALLGEGRGTAISKDGRSVLAVAPNGKDLLLIPTGAGETRRISTTLDLADAAFHPDGKRFILVAAGSDLTPRLYDLPLEGGQPHPLSNELTWGNAQVTPDGTRAFLFNLDPADPITKILDLGTHQAQTIVQPAPYGFPMTWSNDGSEVFVAQTLTLPAAIYRWRLAGNQQSKIADLSPADPSSVDGVDGVVITPDGASYAYTYRRVLAADLYLIEGLK